MWAILALGAALLTSFNPLLYKQMVKDAPVLVVVWSVILLSLPLLGFLALVTTPQLPNLDWIFGASVLASAALNVAAHLCSTRALKLADVSQVTPLLNITPVFTLFLSALWLGEIPTARGLIGVVVVLLGAYWLNRPEGMGWFAPLQHLAFTPANGLVLLAGLLWAITPVLEKTAIEHTSPPSPRFVAFVVSAFLGLFLTFAVAARRTAIHKLSAHRRAWLLAGLIAGTAPILGYTAFSLGLVGYVTTLFKLGSVMTVVWSYLLLHETGALRRLPAAVVMVLGALLIVL